MDPLQTEVMQEAQEESASPVGIAATAMNDRREFCLGVGGGGQHLGHNYL